MEYITDKELQGILVLLENCKMHLRLAYYGAFHSLVNYRKCEFLDFLQRICKKSSAKQYKFRNFSLGEHCGNGLNVII